MSTKKLSYNEAYAELESILQKLEGNDLDVDELSTQVKRASSLIKICKGKLHDTEAEVEKILDEMENED